MTHILLDNPPSEIALSILEMKKVRGADRVKLVQDLYWPRILKSSGKKLQGRGGTLISLALWPHRVCFAETQGP